MESYARCKTPVSGTSVNIKELQTTEKRNVLLSVVSNVQYSAQQHLKQKFTRLGKSPYTSLGKDSLWRTVEKQMSILVSVSNPEMNPFAEREAFWLPCAERSSALARNSPKRSHGKVYSK
ncbi:tRNA wybutosine-synthesizing protein [Trichinella spiralis]|uniref:tRNA wybutosine-synthesizing protein n=1 Tax=Trichinella spiralis TaxID=6334 RepID=A0ABR3K6Z2_TRISP